MSVARDLTVTVTNDAEGVTLTLKTVSSLGSGKLFISGDPAVHDVKEIEEALKQIKEFTQVPTVIVPEGEPLRPLEPGEITYVSRS